MEIKEIFERRDIRAGDRLLGYASVRYPVFDESAIDSFYKKLAKAFLDAAVSKKLCGALNCRIAYEDEENISVMTESRLYKATECVSRHRSSLVWHRKYGILRYLRRHGIRYCNICYDGRELKKFD